MILRKRVNENKTNWDKKLNRALWAYRTSYKTVNSAIYADYLSHCFYVQFGSVLTTAKYIK